MTFVLMVGYLTILILCSIFLYLVGNRIYVHVFSHPVDLKQYGKWAVVSGATDGIGKGYAVELAKRGLDVLILGRNKDRLQAAVDDIQATAAQHVTVDSYEIDFGTVNVRHYENLSEKLSKMDVGILINNVGVSYSRAEHLHLLDNNLEFLKTIIEVNCVPVTLLSSIVLSQMVKKNRGAIVNVSSSLGGFHAGFMTVYCATKAYVNSLTTAMQREYSHTKIDIQCISPFYVASKMSKIRKSSFFVPSSEEYAREAVKTIGKASFTYGCPSHSILGSLTELVIAPVMSYYSTKHMRKMREIYLKKNGKTK